MNITVTYKTPVSENIVQIDRRQEIGAGLKILQETGKDMYIGKPDFFRSYTLGRMVSAYCTFEELGIYSGDVLSIEDGSETTAVEKEELNGRDD